MDLVVESMIEYSPAQIEELIGDSNMGICVDLGHAVRASVSQGIDYKIFMKKLLVFEPKVFHLSDGMLDNEKDEHLSLGKGELVLNIWRVFREL